MALTNRIRNFHAAIPIGDLSQVSEARRAVELEAKLCGFEETQRGKLAIVVTEIATNIARHTPGGELLYRLLDLPTGQAMEVLGVDRGPGMVDTARCLADGFSTGATPGNGFGAIQRQSDEFDLYSMSGRGTAVLARVRAGKALGTNEAPDLSFGGVSVPYPGEALCGDAWRLCWGAAGFSLLVSDGLGHGLKADEASWAAMDVFEQAPFTALPALMQRIDQGLRGTRGGTVAIATFDAGRKRLVYSGIGNISGRLIVGAGSRGLISSNGTVGAHTGKFQQFEYEWPLDATLVMHSDGLQTRWDIGSYPGLALRHPGVIAATLYRDYQRGRDDVTVAAVKYNSKPGLRGLG